MGWAKLLGHWVAGDKGVHSQAGEQVVTFTVDVPQASPSAFLVVYGYSLHQ